MSNLLDLGFISNLANREDSIPVLSAFCHQVAQPAARLPGHQDIRNGVFESKIQKFEKINDLSTYTVDIGNQITEHCSIHYFCRLYTT